jgi:hypothetical protein
MAKRSIGELEDEIKQRDRRIEDLRTEIDEQRDLIQRFREHAEDYNHWLERLGEVLNDTWWDEHVKLEDDYNDLVHDWNKCVPLINGSTQPVGRPLAASEAQRADVLRLHKEGMSLRGIAEELTLGFQTVRTIIAQGNGTDRTSRKHRQRAERIEIDQTQVARWKRQRRTGNALPQQAQRVAETGQKLIKEAKGLGRS